MRLLSGYFSGFSLSLLIGLLCIYCIGALAQTDPTALPAAQRQTPNWDAYTALGVRSAGAGFVYADPATGAPVHKLTSAEFPVPNLFAVHDYSEGGPYISAEWGDRMHTIALRVVENSDTIATWFVDYQRGTSIASNWRRAPIFLTELALAFSNRPGFERIVYFVSGTRLYRADTVTMTLQGEATIPLEGLQVDTVPITPNWLQSSYNDEWFVFHAPSERRVYAFNRLSGQLSVREFPGLDEPALDRAGGFVLIRDGGGGLASCPRSGFIFEDVWHLRNLTTGAVACRGGPVDGGIYAAHTGWGQGIFPSINNSLTNSPTFYFDSVTGRSTETANFADENYFGVDHHALQWIQGVGDVRQWYYGSNFNEGRVSDTGWSAYTGNIYRTGIDWTPRYQKPAIGVRGVYQTAPADANLIRHTLTPVNSLSAVREGSFFYDGATEQLYVWAHGGGSPAGRVLLAAAGPVHNGIGARRIDGSDTRLIAHHYSWPGGAVAYRQMPLATTSPDGKLVMFTSNMGLRDVNRFGRLDVFVVEMPVADTGGTGALRPVVWSNTANALLDANSLYENCDCGLSFAISAQQIAGGDGYFEFTAAGDQGRYAAGLDSADTLNASGEIEFSLVFSQNGYAEVREGGLLKAEIAYAAGDRFRVAVEDGDINYYARRTDAWVLIHSSESPAALSYPLHGTAIQGPAQSVTDAIMR